MGQQYPLWWLGLGWPETNGTEGRLRRILRHARRRFNHWSQEGQSLPAQGPTHSTRSSNTMSQGSIETSTRGKIVDGPRNKQVTFDEVTEMALQSPARVQSPRNKRVTFEEVTDMALQSPARVQNCDP